MSEESYLFDTYSYRNIRESDLRDIVRYANNPDIAKNMTNRFPHPYTEKDGEAFIELALKDDPAKILAITDSDIFIGAVGIFPQDDVHCKNAEMGWWIGEPYWRKGITMKLVPHLLEYGFSTWDLNRIFAKPFGKNIASQKVLEKCGFRLEGTFRNSVYKHGEFQDELVYAFYRDML